MSDILRLTIRILNPAIHCRADGDQPEWPPSPLRLFQAMVAAAANRWNEREDIKTASKSLEWLETLTPLGIVAPFAVSSSMAVTNYVPDNVADLLIPAWKRGDFKKTVKRTEKIFQSIHLSGDPVPEYPQPAGIPIHYLFKMRQNGKEFLPFIESLARSITHFGWGIDIAMGDCAVINLAEAARLEGNHYKLSVSGNYKLRVPVVGTFNALKGLHASFLKKLNQGLLNPYPPLTMFKIATFCRDDEPAQLPYEVFELRKPNGELFAYPHRRFIHIAGMTRHLAISKMTLDPPRKVPADWQESFVAGHKSSETNLPHRQFSFIPLPSVGHAFSNPGIRRVMITAPAGCEAWLKHLGLRLAGARLEPNPDTRIPEAPFLDRPRSLSVIHCYVNPSNVWASVTPIILPGHDDRKPSKTRALIEKALVQAGITASCDFEWQAQGWFPKTCSSHKYDKNKKPTGYIRPNHLLNQTAVHLKLTFTNGVMHPGPIAIGAGRHCGFGILANWNNKT